MLSSVRSGSRRLQQQQQQQARAALGMRALATAVPDVHLPDGGATLPSHARCVIVGGGVIGLSTAYHLAKHGGWKEVLLLEQSRLTSGTTWHAAGLVGTSRPTATETLLSIEGTRLYDGVLEEETGVATGYKACGSLTVARTPERLHALKRAAAKARSFGLGAEIVSPQQCADHWNGVLTPDGLVGGLWLPGDGSASPTDLSMSFAAGARLHGVRIAEGVRVEGFEAAAVAEGGGGGGGRRRVRAVTTQGGQRVEADTVILCGGQWTRQVGYYLQLYSAFSFFYLLTTPSLLPSLLVGRGRWPPLRA
jgi:4-methylaminobutanoate oxidase (formaldehyde-forming)